MTKRDHDDLRVLRHHLRAKAAGLAPGSSSQELINHILHEHIRDRPSLPRPPRRWRALPIVVAIMLGASAGAVVTAAVIAGKKATNISQGVVCRSDFDQRASAIVIDFGEDPVADCAAFWESGELPIGTTIAGLSAPPMLMACTSVTGVFEVFPTPRNKSCADIGLEAADVEGTVEDPSSVLGRLVRDVNAQCLSVEKAVEQGQGLLDDLRMTGWRIEVVEPDGHAGGGCTVLALDPESRSLRVISLPISG